MAMAIALLLDGDHAARITGHQPPGQPGGHAGQETGNEGNDIMRRQGRHRIEHQEAADGQQQHIAPAPAARQRREGNGRQDGTDGVDGHELTRHDFGNAQALGDLRQQAGRQGFRQDGDKTRHGQGQQGQDGKALGNGRCDSGRWRHCGGKTVSHRSPSGGAGGSVKTAPGVLRKR